MTCTIQDLTVLLHKFWDPEHLEQLARETGCVQRQPTVTGAILAQALVFGCLERANPSLNHWAQVCLDLGVDITPQGFDQRITDASAVFLEHLFRDSLDLFRSHIRLPLEVFKPFSAVNLIDSTYISLPANLAAAFPGSGGDASPAGLKVQLMLDFLHERLTQVAVRSGREPDQAYTAFLSAVAPGSLNVLDLGYFCLDTFATLGRDKAAYWISRFLPGTGVFTTTGEPLDLVVTLRASTAARVELAIQLGSTHRLSVRLIAVRVPQAVADRRRQRAKEQARKKGRTPSAAHLALLAWTIVVTNVPDTWLNWHQILTVYRVRWQIELVFKLWKSYAGLARVAGHRRARVLTELYAKLVGLVLTHFLLAPLRGRLADPSQEVSRVQVRQIFQRFARDLNRALGMPELVMTTLTELLQHLRRFGFKQRRRKSPNVEQRLALIAAALDAPEIISTAEGLQYVLP